MTVQRGVETDVADGQSGQESNRSTVKSFAVLELLGRAATPLSLAEIARATELNKTTARRFVATLCELGYVERLEDGRHRLTPRVLDLSSMYFNTTVLPGYAMPHLEQFCRDTGMSTSLAILDRTDVVYTARVSQQRTLSLAVHIGSRLPAHATAIGKALLSFLSATEIKRRYDGAELEARTTRTIATVPDLIGALGEVRRQGFALSEEECEIGVRAAAYPLTSPTGELIAAVSVSTRTEEIPRIEFLQRILPAFLGTAHAIAQAAPMSPETALSPARSTSPPAEAPDNDDGAYAPAPVMNTGQPISVRHAVSSAVPPGPTK